MSLSRSIARGCAPGDGLQGPLRWHVLAATTLLVLALGSRHLQAQDPPPVIVETVRKVELIDKLELSGTVTSPQVSRISVSVPGLIEAVNFDSGARVQKGDTLVELDPALEKIELQKSAAEIADAKAQLKDSYRRLKIAQGLAKRSYGPQNNVDEIETEIEVRKAAIAQLEAQRAATKERLSRHIIKAPFSGVISQRMAEVGQWVNPGTAIFELVDMTGLRIDIPIPQQYYQQINSKPKVELMFDALPDVVLLARIEAIIPVSDPTVRTFTTRVVPINPNIKIAPGMSARVVISLQHGESGLVVSRDAVLRQPDGRTTVWLIDENGDEPIARERRVEIGNTFDGLVHVRSGLKEGDRVVVRGNESLREGQAVKLSS